MTITCPATDAEYFIGDELGDLALWWFEEDDLVDFTVAHSYSAKLVTIDGQTTIFTTTTGFTGAVGSGTEDSGVPNLVKTWPTTGELNAVTAAGPYIFQIVATQSAGSKQRTAQITLTLRRRY